MPTLLRGWALSSTGDVGGGEVRVRFRVRRRSEPKTDWWELVLDSQQRKEAGGVMARTCAFFSFLFFSFTRCELKQLKICILFCTICPAVSLHLCSSPGPIRMVGMSQQLFVFKGIRQTVCP